MEELRPVPNNQEKSNIRKAAFGRTNLFLKDTGVLFREVKCTSSSMTRFSTASIFHQHDACEHVCKTCWHCCYDFDDTTIPIRLPRLFDPNEEMYHVYGWFCCPSCAKAYILEHATFDRGYQMNVFIRMLREIYKITDPVIESPPRISLQRFGGPFDIEQFRKLNNICSVISPPFISYCMLIEERKPIENIGETANRRITTVRGLRQPVTGTVKASEDDIIMPISDGLYTKFITENEKDVNNDVCSKKSTKRLKTGKDKKTPNGGLERFSVGK